MIQARLGSTRLPGKILRPFAGEDCLFDLLIDKLSRFGAQADCIVATSEAPADAEIEVRCRQKGVKCFRGSESDVLQRFIDAAHTFGKRRLIRVCSDNPFLSRSEISRLLQAAAHTAADYLSFDVGGTPSIRTHYGFWTEYVRLEALEKVASLTGESLYHEHVTNYIYAHPEIFRTEWLTVGKEVLAHPHVRLTIDTPEDFETASRVYAELGSEADISQLLACLDAHPQWSASMDEQISRNSK